MSVLSDASKEAWTAFVSGSKGSTNSPSDQAKFWAFVKSAERDGFAVDVGMLIEAFDVEDVSQRNKDQLVEMIEAVSGYLQAT